MVMKKMLILLFIFSHSAFASECTITHYIIPPAKELNWTSSKSLIKSFTESQISAFKHSFADTQRKAIGHVVSHIKVNEYEQRWTSISVKSNKMLPKLIRHGINGMFVPIKGARVQNAKEILRFVKHNKNNYRLIQMKASENECKQLIEVDDHLREKAKKNELYFGPTITDIKKGGTGASYAIYMIQFIEPSYPVEIFKQRFRSYEFFDAYKMWKSLEK